MKNSTFNKRTIACLCIFLGVASFYMFYPGWMSQDSFSHYQDATSAVYRDWTPVLYSWIWNKLLFAEHGPAPMLFLNVALYWLGFYFLSDGISRRSPTLGCILPFLGLWPGLLYEVGYLWKDILFAVSMFVGWAILIRIQFSERKPNNLERGALIILMLIAFGVKTNGITAFPFLAAYWAYIERLNERRKFVKYAFILLATVMPVIAMKLITLSVEVAPKNKMLVQYTMIYDVLGISVRTDTLLLPDYIIERFGTDIQNYRPFYYPGGNNHMFFGIGTGGKNAFTNSEEHLAQLGESWLSAIGQHPGTYISHRWANFVGMARIGTFLPGWVGEPGIIENKLGLKFQSNFLSDLLIYAKNAAAWMYLPWLYMIMYGVAIAALVIGRHPNTGMWLLLSLSIAGFVGPHFFILPAIDYRYLYFAYLGTLVLLVLAFENVCFKLRKDWRSESSLTQ